MILQAESAATPIATEVHPFEAEVIYREGTDLGKLNGEWWFFHVIHQRHEFLFPWLFHVIPPLLISYFILW